MLPDLCLGHVGGPLLPLLLIMLLKPPLLELAQLRLASRKSKLNLRSLDKLIRKPWPKETDRPLIALSVAVVLHLQNEASAHLQPKDKQQVKS